jgi:aryl-alcohol dehydrogenase-like predicted oxidoreductase
MGHNEMLLRDALRGRDRGSVFIQVKFGGQRDPRARFPRFAAENLGRNGPQDEIAHTGVRFTYVGGQQVYAAPR